MNGPVFNIGRASDQLPLARLDEADRASLARIAAERRRQVEDFGHTADHDAKLPACTLPKSARSYIDAAIEDLQFGHGPQRAITRLEKSAALILAAIARLHQEPKQ